jgi:hypothetical protein
LLASNDTSWESCILAFPDSLAARNGQMVPFGLGNKGDFFLWGALSEV